MIGAMRELHIDTTRGPALAQLHLADPSRALVVLGPGASGRVESPDIVATAAALHCAGFSVAVVTPPYAVAGRKVPPRGAAADDPWVEVVDALRAEVGDQPVITGGRSFGSRVACRTSEATGSVGVICLAFPLHPPGKPEKSRLADLDAATAPTFIVQGRSDPFGLPPEAAHRRVLVIDGTHTLAERDLPHATQEVVAWAAALLGGARR